LGLDCDYKFSGKTKEDLYSNVVGHLIINHKIAADEATSGEIGKKINDHILEVPDNDFGLDEQLGKLNAKRLPSATGPEKTRNRITWTS
jgi:hypothetical protein